MTSKLICLGMAAGCLGISASAQNLPEPYATPSVTNQSKVLGWPTGKTPTAPAGFSGNGICERVQ